jgi:hypothetical protein
MGCCESIGNQEKIELTNTDTKRPWSEQKYNASAITVCPPEKRPPSIVTPLSVARSEFSLISLPEISNTPSLSSWKGTKTDLIEIH